MAGPSLSMTEDIRRCVQACADCHQYCIETIVHCRQHGGAYVDAAHLRSLLDCAEICQTTTDFMLRGSDLSTSLATFCAVVAERCALSCDRLGEDRQLRACAEAGRRCALLCREMARGVTSIVAA
jgi:hypothetical protein